MNLKFYLDEHIDPDLAEILSERGHKVLEVRNSSTGISDMSHLKTASREQAVIITMDDDFLKLVEEQENHHSVIKVNQCYRVNRLADMTEESTENLKPEEMKNTVIYI